MSLSSSKAEADTYPSKDSKSGNAGKKSHALPEPPDTMVIVMGYRYHHSLIEREDDPQGGMAFSYIEGGGST